MQPLPVELWVVKSVWQSSWKGWLSDSAAEGNQHQWLSSLQTSKSTQPQVSRNQCNYEWTPHMIHGPFSLRQRQGSWCSIPELLLWFSNTMPLRQLVKSSLSVPGCQICQCLNHMSTICQINAVKSPNLYRLAMSLPCSPSPSLPLGKCDAWLQLLVPGTCHWQSRRRASQHPCHPELRSRPDEIYISEKIYKHT